MVLGTGTSGLAGPIGTGVLGTKGGGVVVVSTTPSATIVGNLSSRPEGNSVTYTITVANVAAGTTLYWVMRTTTGTATASDFTDNSLSGSYSLAAGLVNTISRTYRNDFTTEGSEVWVMDIRTGSITGTLIGTSSPATTVTDASTGITASNLYCHYDWSMVTGTSWGGGAGGGNVSLSSGGTAIGLSSTTPAITAVTSAYDPVGSGTTGWGKRYLTFSTGNYAYTASGGAFPQITSSGYTFFEARMITTALTAGYLANTSSWAHSFYSTYGIGTWLTYPGTNSNNYLNQVHTGGYDTYSNITTPVSRDTVNVLHTYVITIIGTAFRWQMCMGSSTAYSGSGNFGSAAQYGTTSSAQRMFFLNYGSPYMKAQMRAMEYGFYNVPLSLAEGLGTAQALYNKWA